MVQNLLTLVAEFKVQSKYAETRTRKDKDTIQHVYYRFVAEGAKSHCLDLLSLML